MIIFILSFFYFLKSVKVNYTYSVFFFMLTPLDEPGGRMQTENKPRMTDMFFWAGGNTSVSLLEKKG